MSKFKIFIIILIGLALPLYILWKIVLVSFFYSSLGEPQSGIKPTEKEFNGRQFLILPESENYYFEKFKLKIKLNNPASINKKIKILAYQGNISSFYPRNKKTLNEEELKKMLFKNNSTDIPIGGLFASGEAVNIMLPGNFYRTIFSADLFQKKGYRWEDLISKEVGFTNNLEQKELWRFGDSYPDGTILEVGSERLLVWEKELFLIQSEVNIKNITKITPIKIEKIEPNPFGNCEIVVDKNTFQCIFEKKENDIESDYVFELVNLTNQEIAESQIRISTSSNWLSLNHNFKVSVDNIKLKLIKKYRGYVFFI